MFARKTLTAGLVALSALTAVPASAAGLGIDFNRGGAAVSVDLYQAHGSNWRYGRGWDRGGDRGWDRNRHRARFLAPYEVRRILRSRGYRQIRYFDRSGAVYRARATDYRGRRVALTINARNGVILDSYRLRRG